LRPILEVAMGVPVLSKAKSEEAGPLRRFQPRVVEAMTCPLWFPARMEFAGTVKRLLPMVVEATSWWFWSSAKREEAEGFVNQATEAEKSVVEALVAVKRLPVVLKESVELVASAPVPLPKRREPLWTPVV
jgi:hypothetical protein